MSGQDPLINILLTGIFIHYLHSVNCNESIISNFSLLKVEQKQNKMSAKSFKLL